LLRLLYIILILYLYLYNPVFLAIGIGSFKIILVISLVFIIAKPHSILLLKKFKIEAFFVFILMIYLFINSLRTLVGPFEHSYITLVWFFESIVFPIFFIFLFKNELEKFGLENLLIITGTLASLVSIILLLNPGWNYFVRNSLIYYSAIDLEGYLEVRGYGIAESLFGSYAMIQGIILGICLYLIRKSIVFFVPVLPLIIAIAFNARTGLFAIPISLLLLVFTGRVNLRWIVIFGFCSVLIFYLFNFNNSFIENNEQTFNWIFSGFDEVVASFTGDFGFSGSTATLLQEETFIPNNVFEFFFGTAQVGPNNEPVDNGYFRTLWFGGGVNLLLLLVFFGFMFYRLWRIDRNKYYILLLFVSCLFYNLKWNFLFVPSGISRLIGLYYVWNIWLYYNRNFDQLSGKNPKVV
jgi:hypothetical protein